MTTRKSLLKITVCLGIGFSCKVRSLAPQGEDSESMVLQAATASEGLDVNDLSFLFPAAKSLKEVNTLLKLSDKTTSGKELFPKFIFDAHIAEATGPKMDITIFGPGEGAKIYSSYRIFAARLVPCADSASAASINNETDFINKKCSLQLRLVAQPYEDESDAKNLGTDPGDHAIHLVYTFPGQNQLTLLKSMIPELQAIKKSAASEAGNTAYVPLGVHPALKKTGLENSKTLSLINQFVLKYSNIDTTSHVAMMITDQTGDVFWNFFMTEIDPGNKNNPIKRMVPLFDKSNRQIFSGKLAFEDKQFAPALNMIKTLKVVRELTSPQRNLSTIKTQVAELVKSDLPKAYEISNPAKTPIAIVQNGALGLKTDCFSCHLATPSISAIASLQQGIARGETDLLSEEGKVLDVFELPQNGRMEHADSGVTPFLVAAHLTKGIGYAFRNFGLSNIQGKQIITISEYVVNESVISANLINKISSTSGPAVLKKECQKGGSNRRKLEECIYTGGGMACYTKFECK